jgi:hypothetical protein
MTDFVIQSNESSTLLRTLNSKPRIDLAYATKPSYPILSKRCFSIPSENVIVGSPYGQTVIFKIPRGAYVRNFLIQNLVAAAAAPTDASGIPLGLKLFESIEFRTNNKVIFSISDAGILAFSQHAPLAMSNAIYRRSLNLNGVTGAVAAGGDWAGAGVTTYTPTFAVFLDSVYNNIDSGFWEPISVHCKISTGARMGITANQLTALTSTLWVWTYTSDLEYHNKIRSKNMNPQYPLNMLGYNTFLEKMVCTSTTVNTMKLNVNYPVREMFFFIKRITDGALSVIQDYDFTVAGSKILENVNWLVSDYETDCAGSSAIHPTSATAISRFTDANRIRWLTFCMDPYDRTYNSGAASFNNLLSPTLTLRTAALAGGAADNEIHVVYVYHNIVSFDASNGQIAISAST